MKSLFRFFPLLLLLFSGCQLLPKKKFDLATYTPPNCKPIGPGLYLDETEIANIHWLEFLFFIRDSLDPKEYELLIPDSTVFRAFTRDSSNFLVNGCTVETAPNNLRSWGMGSRYDSLFNSDRLAESYLRYPGQRYYPVIGVSYHAADAYCRWRSAAVNYNLAKELEEEGKPYRIVTNFHLPSPSEYRLAYAQGHPGKIPPKYFQSTCKTYQTIFPHEKNVAANVLYHGYHEGKVVTTPQEIGYEHVYTRPPTGKGFHHLVCNVAELTSDPDSVWGKSMMDVVEPDSLNNSNWLMDAGHRPNFYTGFRCACEFSVVPASTYKPYSAYTDPDFRNDMMWLNAWKASDSIKVESNSVIGKFVAGEKHYFECEIPVERILTDTLEIDGQRVPIGGTFHLKKSRNPQTGFRLTIPTIDTLEVTIAQGKREITTFFNRKHPEDSLFWFSTDQLKGAPNEHIYVANLSNGRTRLFWMQVKIDD